MWWVEPAASPWSVLSGFGLCTEQEQELAPVCVHAPVLVWLGSKSAQRTQEACCPARAQSDFLLLLAAMAEARVSWPLSFRQGEGVPPFLTEARHGGTRGGPGIMGSPQTPEKWLLFPHLLLGTGEVVSICYRKLGLWVDLMVVADRPFSISSTNCPGGGSYGNCGVAGQQWVLPRKRPL